MRPVVASSRPATRRANPRLPSAVEIVSSSTSKALAKPKGLSKKKKKDDDDADFDATASGASGAESACSLARSSRSLLTPSFLLAGDNFFDDDLDDFIINDSEAFDAPKSKPKPKPAPKAAAPSRPPQKASGSKGGSGMGSIKTQAELAKQVRPLPFRTTFFLGTKTGP